MCFVIRLPERSNNKIMYIHHALIHALSDHIIHINLTIIFYIHVEHSPTKTDNLHKVLYGKKKERKNALHTDRQTHTHTDTHTHTHTHTYARTHARTHARIHTHIHTHTHTRTHTHALTHAYIHPSPPHTHTQ